ncbi:MAG: hypothetical protein ABFE08_05400 [Armatimonadia bacterium]
MFGDEIYVDKKPGPFEALPRVPASKPGFVKHVHCDGAREHVVSYGCRVDVLGRSSAEIRCSEPKCIINYKEVKP